MGNVLHANKLKCEHTRDRKFNQVYTGSFLYGKRVFLLMEVTRWGNIFVWLRLEFSDAIKERCNFSEVFRFSSCLVSPFSTSFVQQIHYSSSSSLVSPTLSPKHLTWALPLIHSFSSLSTFYENFSISSSRFRVFSLVLLSKLYIIAGLTLVL